MKLFFFSALFLGIMAACTSQQTDENPTATETTNAVTGTTSKNGTVKHFRGLLTGGMKGDSIFFDVNAAGTKLENLTFKGYWRCNGKLEQERAAGPMGSFTLVNGKVNDHISEPPDGGASAWRFDLLANIDGNTASGTFRMNINGLGCNTGTLQWTAEAK